MLHIQKILEKQLILSRFQITDNRKAHSKYPKTGCYRRQQQPFPGFPSSEQQSFRSSQETTEEIGHQTDLGYLCEGTIGSEPGPH